MAHPTGESKDRALKLDFDRRLMVQFRGSVVTSDAGLLAYRELDDALGPSAVAGETLTDARTGKNGRDAAVVTWLFWTKRCEKIVRRPMVMHSTATNGRSAFKFQRK
jgi:hypothetical protein